MKQLFIKIIVITLVIFFFGNIFQAQAITPTVLFSDLTDAPISGWEGSFTKGAAISIYARNINDTRGSSYITVGGINLTNDTDYAEWGATINPTVPLGMKRITFFLNSNMTTGGAYPNTTITLTTPEGTSEAIPFHTRDLGENHIYIVSQSGLDSNGSIWVGSWVRENLTAGDIAYVRAGTYSQEDDDSIHHPWNTGGNITFGMGDNAFHNGSLGLSIAVVAYPTESVVWEAKDHPDGHPQNFIRFINTHISYWTFAKFTTDSLTGIATNDNTTPPYDIKFDNLRIIGLDMTTMWVDNCDNNNYIYGDIIDLQGGSGSQYFYFYGNYLHDVMVNYRGQAQACPGDSGFRAYNFYYNGYGTWDYYYMGWNEFAYNNSARGVMLYGHNVQDRLNHAIFHNNYIHDTVRQPFVTGGDGYSDYEFITQLDFYNNIIDSDVDDVCAAFGNSQSSGGKQGYYNVYNNVFDASGSNSCPALQMSADMREMNLYNNIIISTPNSRNHVTYYPEAETAITGTFHGSNNIYYGLGTAGKPSWDSSTFDNINPDFVSVSVNTFSDFQLQSTSPARDNGTTISIITTDFLGIPCPQGSAWDIGVYEYVENQTIRADVNNNSIINSTDALLTLRNSLGLDMSGTNWQSSATTGDVNCDNVSNSTDAMLILRQSLGLDMSGTGWCG